jgi:hypothetical protein
MLTSETQRSVLPSGTRHLAKKSRIYYTAHSKFNSKVCDAEGKNNMNLNYLVTTDAGSGLATG